ncbi:MAG: hypothetical protein R2748_18350 [Bryobacterales bacterium]
MATLIAVWLFMPPIGWSGPWAVWVYALAWLLVNDRIKLAMHKVVDPIAAPSLANKPANP